MPLGFMCRLGRQSLTGFTVFREVRLTRFTNFVGYKLLEVVESNLCNLNGFTVTHRCRNGAMNAQQTTFSSFSVLLHSRTRWPSSPARSEGMPRLCPGDEVGHRSVEVAGGTWPCCNLRVL